MIGYKRKKNQEALGRPKTPFETKTAGKERFL